jgi:hypothetical protein
MFLFSKRLAVKEVTAPNSGNDRWFDVYNSNSYIGELGFRINQTIGSFTQIIFDEPNTSQGYTIDTITLTFGPELNNSTNIYLDSNYPTLSTTFSQDNQGRTVITLGNMEIYHGASVPINLIAQNYQNKSLPISADVSYHQTSFLQLTSLKAHLSLNVQIPVN